MDPYLEPHWPDVHAKLIAYSADELNGGIPGDLIARAEERVTLKLPDGGEDRRFTPDVRVFQAAAAGPRAGSNGAGPNGGPSPRADAGWDADADGGVAVALAPFRLDLIAEEIVEQYIEIRDARDGGRLVTVVEFVSPANKIGRGREEFADKRAELLSSGVSVVEIDLVRAGNWRALLRPYVVPTGGESAYRATIFTPPAGGRRRPSAHFHPMPLRDPLPAVKIPLRSTDAPADLALQPLVDRAYRNGRYARTLDYADPPDPPLDPDDAAWAAGLERERAA